MLEPIIGSLNLLFESSHNLILIDFVFLSAAILDFGPNSQITKLSTYEKEHGF